MLHTKKEWEEFARLDEKWAVLTHEDKKFQRWSDKDFYQTGELEVKKILDQLDNIGIDLKYNKALDFGCGVGRLTFPLAKKFGKVDGVDFSKGMLMKAKAKIGVNADRREIKGRVAFIYSDGSDLSRLGKGKYDLIISLITLQHFPSRTAIKRTLYEFIKTLRSGGILYFQIPTISRYGWKENILKYRGKLYFGLRKIGFSQDLLYRKLNIAPYMHMQFLTTKQISKIFKGRGKILKIYNKNSVETCYVIKKGKG